MTQSINQPVNQSINQTLPEPSWRDWTSWMRPWTALQGFAAFPSQTTGPCLVYFQCKSIHPSIHQSINQIANQHMNGWHGITSHSRQSAHAAHSSQSTEGCEWVGSTSSSSWWRSRQSESPCTARQPDNQTTRQPDNQTARQRSISWSSRAMASVENKMKTTRDGQRAYP